MIMAISRVLQNVKGSRDGGGFECNLLLPVNGGGGGGGEAL